MTGLLDTLVQSRLERIRAFLDRPESFELRLSLTGHVNIHWSPDGHQTSTVHASSLAAGLRLARELAERERRAV